ncbi:efflux RND transporter periplasmic adaptor subunit [Paenibacillus radicis (ex Gao et al. 2016)]|uniref:RND transporter n=1 Tax=Paenibacillus radicis (ex Gao et al. 2016) TaxID=1737354 RepID=A0A917H4D5_9BACL|nr:biotin/lipoyl-binding protein [Paenibacillus radicis (ex Gao et al. 2016)]GGG67023.1 RND transporter [Paenibacillus radicis (ex Gao et al. 2016)]
MDLDETAAQSRKRKIRRFAALFFGLLIVLTLTGNTLQALTLPKVYTAQANRGELAHAFKGTGTVVPAEMKELANPAGWKVAHVLVKQGERVSKGQTLVQYDDSEAKQQLAEAQSALKKLQLSMEGLEHSYILAVTDGDESAKLSAKLAIETAKLDIADQKQRIQFQQAGRAENQRLTAPFDGVVAAIGATEGLGSSGAPDIQLTNAAKGFQVEMLIPSTIAELLSEGDLLELQLTGEEQRMLEGRVAAMKSDSLGGNAGDLGGGGAGAGGQGQGAVSSTLLTLAVVDGKGLKGGERVELNLSKVKSAAAILIPNDAVHKDVDGAYVYTVEEHQGPLGNAYYVARTPIEIADANETTTAVSQGLFDQQNVIVNSSEPVIDGVRVRY